MSREFSTRVKQLLTGVMDYTVLSGNEGEFAIHPHKLVLFPDTFDPLRHADHFRDVLLKVKLDGKDDAFFEQLETHIENIATRENNERRSPYGPTEFEADVRRKLFESLLMPGPMQACMAVLRAYGLEP